MKVKKYNTDLFEFETIEEKDAFFAWIRENHDRSKRKLYDNSDDEGSIPYNGIGLESRAIEIEQFHHETREQFYERIVRAATE